MSNGGPICFRQLRKTAEVVKQATAIDSHDRELTRAICKRLLPDVQSQNIQIRAQVKLAILEFQRVSELDLDVDIILDGIADEITQGHSLVLKEIIIANYDQDAVLGLIDWLIHRIGSQISQAMTTQQQDRSKRDRKGKMSHLQPRFESAAVLLDCIFRYHQDLGPDLPASYFNVVALDVYIKANKHNEEVMISSCQFNNLLTLPTKLDLLSSDFSRRHRIQNQEQMYANIYAGSNYQRSSNGGTSTIRVLEVERQNILNDSKELLIETTGSLSQGLKIIFKGEEGEDAGGLLKEWMLILCKELVPLVFYQGEVEGAKSELRTECSPSDTQLMGVIIGLSIRHRIPLDISIPHYIYRYLFLDPESIELTLDDLDQLRPVLARGLAEMLSWEEEGFSERLSVTFTYHPKSEGEAVLLIANGDEIAVRYTNRELYVKRLCSHILHEQSQAQMQALYSGLDLVCHDLLSLQLFSTDEIDGLVCGQEIALNVASLKRISSVDPPSQSDDYIDDFWYVLEQADDQSILRRLLHFVTANHRIPLLSSSKELTIVFRIVVLHGEDFVERLPTASTCTNTLFLPRYSTKEKLRFSLFTALYQGSVGFGLK